MYSSVLFFFVTSKTILIIAPIKKAINETAIIFIHPKNNPIAPISFTSPNPIASFPAIRPPINVISKNIPAPTKPPSNISIPTDTLFIPCKNVNTKPTSNIVRFNLLGII